MRGAERMAKRKTWRMTGMEDYVTYVERLAENSEEILGEAVYEMAKVVADRVRANLEALPTVTNAANIAMYKHGRSKLSDVEKKGLLDGFGISTAQNDNGYFNVKLGFEGYNGVKTKKYPNGQPNQLIARSLEFGSSIAQKHPFVRPAINASRKRAEAKMAEVLDEEIGKIMDTD